jgi:hypothetical protein
MSWKIFKENILNRANAPDSIQDIDTVAKLYADEYDMCMKRGGDVINKVPISKGNTEIMQQLFKAALLKGQTSNTPYDLVGEMGKGVLAYWQGAQLNTFPIPLIPAPGSTVNIGVTSNLVTNAGVWAPAIATTGVLLAPPEIPVDILLASIPDDNNTVEGVTPVVILTSPEILNDAPLADIIILPGIDYSGAFMDPQLEAVKVIVSQGQPLPTDDTNSTPENETGEKGDVNNIPIECIDSAVRDKYGVINYELPLTTNMKVRTLTLDTRWAHKLQDMNSGNANYKKQGGEVKVEEIVCNLKSLSLNIIEPLLKEYPGFLPINSAFRASSSRGGTSQHMVGEAIDVQWFVKGVGISTEKYMEIANWMLKNLPVDQLIYEHTETYGNVWLHISHRKDGKQRGQAMTMKKNKDGEEVYTLGFKNYYPTKKPK